VSRQVEWSPRALRVLSRLDRPTQHRISEAVDLLAGTGRGDVKRLKGSKIELFRLRVGGWRIIFSMELENILAVRTVRARGDVYK